MDEEYREAGIAARMGGCVELPCSTLGHQWALSVDYLRFLPDQKHLQAQFSSHLSMRCRICRHVLLTGQSGALLTPAMKSGKGTLEYRASDWRGDNGATQSGQTVT